MELHIHCPKCGNKPDDFPEWNCESCGVQLHPFKESGICPSCNKRIDQVMCLPHSGGCGHSSSLPDWLHSGGDIALDLWENELLKQRLREQFYS